MLSILKNVDRYSLYFYGNDYDAEALSKKRINMLFKFLSSIVLALGVVSYSSYASEAVTSLDEREAASKPISSVCNTVFSYKHLKDGLTGVSYRLTPDTQPYIVRYLAEQKKAGSTEKYNPKNPETGNPLQLGVPTNAANTAMDVINYTTEESFVYFVYLTKDTDPRPFHETMKEAPYTFDTMVAQSHSGVNNILMFVTVTSSVGDPFATPLGITCSREAILSASRPKGIAPLLLAYGMKVVHDVNPALEYLITKPLPVMRDILISRFPSHVHWGTWEEYDSFMKAYNESSVETRNKSGSGSDFGYNVTCSPPDWLDYKCKIELSCETPGSMEGLHDLWEKARPAISIRRGSVDFDIFNGFFFKAPEKEIEVSKSSGIAPWIIQHDAPLSNDISNKPLVVAVSALLALLNGDEK